MLSRINELFSGIWISIISGAFLLLSLIHMLTALQFPLDPAWATIVLSGYPLLYLALTRLIYEKWISSALLISIAMLASLGIGEIFAAGEVAFIMAIGATLEEMTVNRAQKGLNKLISIVPAEGRRLVQHNDGYIEEIIPAQEIQRGDLLRILPGETIPVDGIILKGDSSVDQSVMTGESLPVDKSAGEAVYSGTINCFGSIDIEAEAVGEDSSLQKLISLVQEAEKKKAPMQRIVDKWAVWLVPIALGISVGAFFFNWLLGTASMIALNRAVTVLVVFCPCALALATPTSIIAAIGQATRYGVIIKSGEALEKMAGINVVAFDKTGTLTHGNLEISDLVSFNTKLSEESLLQLCASVEAKSEHPLAQAIVQQSKIQKLDVYETEDFKMEAGKGVSARIKEMEILCGNENYLNENGVIVPDNSLENLNTLRAQGKALVLLAIDRQCVGVVALSDSLRPTSGIMIKELWEMAAEPVLLTGDNPMAASYLARKLGIENINANLLPEEKVNKIMELQKNGKKICMVGDGINDAPALKTSDVGVAMGDMGSDIAVDAADIVLLSDNISRVPYLKRLANSTVRTIKGNIIASMCVNAIAIVLSVMGVLNPVSGALVHNAGSVLVVLNAALLYVHIPEETGH